jgi:AraC-like DNA-binding protein
MSRTRQRLVAGTVHRYAAGAAVAPHSHPSAQLIWAASGVMRTTTPDGTWVLPPTRALLVPARTPHEHEVPSPARMHTLLLAGGEQVRTCRLLAVDRLAGELIVTLSSGRFDPTVEPAYLAVLDDQLRLADPLDLGVALPDDPLLRRVVRGLLEDPGDPATLDEWGRRVGASGRTLARRFRAATGTSFDGWRRRVRMLRALELLAGGGTVAAVAHTVGYASASAFVHAFRQLTGTTPAAAIAASGAGAGGADGAGGDEHHQQRSLAHGNVADERQPR